MQQQYIMPYNIQCKDIIIYYYYAIQSTKKYKFS